MRISSLFRVTCITLLLVTSACSTVIEGRTQTISVDTFPSGADCAIKDNDTVLAKVHTPGVATIEKSKNDILVECAKEGYIANKKRNRSDMAITSAGNMVFGQWSFVGNMVDSASGASHKYDSKVFMGLTPLPPVAQIHAGEPASVAVSTAQPDWAHMPADQLAHNLSQMLASQNVVVTHQSPEEVMRMVAGHETIPNEAQNISVLELADASVPIHHNAE